jgi:hypothetical protein
VNRVLTVLSSPAPSSGSAGLHLPQSRSGWVLLIAAVLVGRLLVEQIRLSVVRRREQQVLDRQELQRALARRRAERRLDALEQTRRGGPASPVLPVSRPALSSLWSWLWCWLQGRLGGRSRSGR